MQRLILPAVLAVVTAATAAVRATDPQPRFGRALSQYAALDPDQRQAWLDDMYSQRLEPACRAAGDAAAYDHAVAEHHLALERIAAGEQLKTEELIALLNETDRQEAAAIEHLAGEYRRVTRDAVGTDRHEFQRRIRLWQAIERDCRQSPYAFDNQPKLEWWLQAAITEQRITAAPPLPAAPDFSSVDDAAWRRPRAETLEAKTALATETQASDGELGSRIADYNASLAELENRLYEARVFSVDELNPAVDTLAELALERIGLTLSVNVLSPQDRRDLPAVEPVDTAIALARIKVSAARRQINPQAQRDLTDAQRTELQGLNQVLRRLDMLASGPDR